MAKSQALWMLNLRRSALLLVIAGTSLATAKGYTQTAASSASSKPLGWDVISVKSVKPAYDGVVSHSTGEFDGYSVMLPLEQLISQAYGIRQDLISGSPAWASTTQYAIEAKVAPVDIVEYRKLSQKQKDLMLQSILADRFKLTAHAEMRQLPVYELVVAKHAKLQEAQPGPGGTSMGSGQLTCKGCNVSILADMLSQSLQRDVVDDTGLTGMYDIKLQWSDSTGPSLFTALEEQLGLKLNSAKGPVKTLVVDHVERPSEN